jgi:hypothetical protein
MTEQEFVSEVQANEGIIQKIRSAGNKSSETMATPSQPATKAVQTPYSLHATDPVCSLLCLFVPVCAQLAFSAWPQLYFAIKQNENR